MEKGLPRKPSIAIDMPPEGRKLGLTEFGGDA
jgi:hypothetical protein